MFVNTAMMRPTTSFEALENMGRVGTNMMEMCTDFI